MLELYSLYPSLKQECISAWEVHHQSEKESILGKSGRLSKGESEAGGG
jgi:hypothetical protein